jgi:hypothetical protein
MQGYRTNSGPVLTSKKAAGISHLTEVIMFKPLMFVFTSIMFVLAQANPATEHIEARAEDSALLPIPGAVLYNNAFGKGDIANYRQSPWHGRPS